MTVHQDDLPTMARWQRERTQALDAIVAKITHSREGGDSYVARLRLALRKERASAFREAAALVREGGRPAEDLAGLLDWFADMEEGCGQL